jgi:FG-GAP repeat protein
VTKRFKRLLPVGATALAALLAVGVMAMVSPSSAAASESAAPTLLHLDRAGIDLVVDTVHQQVFAANTSGGVEVVGFDGTHRATIGTAVVISLAISPDSSEVYGSFIGSQHGLVRIDTTTLTAQTVVTDPACPSFLAYAGSRVWFTTPSGCASTGLGSYDPGSGTVSVTAGLVPANSFIAKAPLDPTHLIVYDRSVGKFDSVDISSATPTAVSAAASDVPCTPTEVLGATGQFVSVCASMVDLYGADLHKIATVSTHLVNITHIATTADGRYLAATGTDPTTGAARISVIDMSNGDALVRTIETPSGLHITGSTIGSVVAWGGDSLYVAASGAAGGGVYVWDHMTTVTAPVTVTAAEKRVYPGGMVHLTGSIGYAPGAASSVQLERQDAAGTHSLGSSAVASDGSFAFQDAPVAPVGPMTYTVTYAGDSGHAGASASIAVLRESRPYDFNGDGYADLAVGAPGEDLGAATDAGDFDISYGHAAGVSGSGSLAVSQNTAGVPGGAETGDRFGYSNASGDFNGDGYADLAVSAPYEDSSAGADAGGIWIFYGSASGLKMTDIQVLNGGHAGERLGLSLAAGELGGGFVPSGRFAETPDQYEDLVATQPGIHSFSVYLGLPTAGFRYPTSYDTGTAAASISLGDVDGNGIADVAVGLPTAKSAKTYATGSVTVFMTRCLTTLSDCPTATWTQTFSKDTAGVPGSSYSYGSDLPDSFGAQVALADLNGDGRADLAVGAPGTPVTTSDGVKHEDAGTVTVLYADGFEIGTGGAITIDQSTPNLPGSPGTHDQFGHTIAAGDLNGDGIADLAIYSPGDHIVATVRGASGSLDTTAVSSWSQNSPGVPGADEAEDRWGASLRFESIKAGAPQALVIGAPGENAGAGAVTVLYSTSSGLTGTGSVALNQNSPGIPGGSETGDAFGTF